jgi:hypothetical protein
MILQFCNYTSLLWALRPDTVGNGRIIEISADPIEITHARKGFECVIIVYMNLDITAK